MMSSEQGSAIIYEYNKNETNRCFYTSKQQEQNCKVNKIKFNPKCEQTRERTREEWVRVRLKNMAYACDTFHCTITAAKQFNCCLIYSHSHFFIHSTNRCEMHKGDREENLQ